MAQIEHETQYRITLSEKEMKTIKDALYALSDEVAQTLFIQFRDNMRS